MQSRDLKTALGKKVRELRDASRLTQAEVAFALSETGPSLSHKEQGKAAFTPSKLDLYLKVVNANLEQQVDCWTTFFLMHRHPRRDAERMAQAKVLGVVAA